MSERDDCHACRNDCNATFRCSVCGFRRNACFYLVGGFPRIEAESRICSICRDRVALPRGFLAALPQSLGGLAPNPHAWKNLPTVVGCEQEDADGDLRARRGTCEVPSLPSVAAAKRHLHQGQVPPLRPPCRPDHRDDDDVAADIGR